MNTPVQISGEEEVARPAPPGFPDRAEMELLLRIGLFSPDDEIALRKVWRILKGQTDDYLDMMLGMVAAHPALVPALTALRGEESPIRWTGLRPFVIASDDGYLRPAFSL